MYIYKLSVLILWHNIVALLHINNHANKMPSETILGVYLSKFMCELFFCKMYKFWGKLTEDDFNTTTLTKNTYTFYLF